jgi:hypothetical protein
MMCRRNNVVHMEMTFCNKAMQAMQARCHTSPINQNPLASSSEFSNRPKFY